MKPLSDLLRPQSVEEMVGQQHLLANDKLLYQVLQSGEVPNMIFYGPSGCGKTTLAKIISKKSNKKLYHLNATTASLSDIKAVIQDINPFSSPDGILLYLDEIQYFNKRQQQSLLEFIENGSITLIASTTENPYFYIYNAILSRCTVFEFKPISPQEIARFLQTSISKISDIFERQVTIDEDALSYISSACGGDVRKAVNSMEMCCRALGTKEDNITIELARQASQKSSMRYDRDGDCHYDILSAFQKSIRGSDENAALHYLARLVEAQDLPSICRRLLVIACEDIGLAYPSAITVTKSCVDAAMMLGFPEARIPLAQAVILLATAPKSNSAIMAIDAALSDIADGKTLSIPADLQDAHFGGAQNLGHGLHYKYPHSFPGHYVKQQYLPDEIKDAVYYTHGDNKNEQIAKAYWDKIKETSK